MECGLMVYLLKNNQKILGRKLTKLENRLFPNGNLQERVFNVTPYLMKYGFSWLEELYEAVDLAHFDHQVFGMGVED